MRGALTVGAAVLFAGCSFGGGDFAPDAAGAPDAAPDAAACPAPYTLTANGCHAFPSATGLMRASWARARAACQALGGDLPVIGSAAEAAYVASALPPTDGRRIWLGLSGAAPDGSTWTWIDGETVAQKALSLWRAGQPAPGTGCAVVRPDTAEWAGRRCDETMIVVCEKSP